MNANKDNQNQVEELKKENSAAPETEAIQEQVEENLATVELQTPEVDKFEVGTGEAETTEVNLAEAVDAETAVFEMATAESKTNISDVQAEPTAQFSKGKTARICMKKKFRTLLKPLLTGVAGLALLGIGIGIGGFAFGTHHGPAHPPAHGPAAEKHHDKEHKHPKPKHDMNEKDTKQTPEGMKILPGERHVGRVDEANPKESVADENGVKMIVIPKAEYDAILKAVKEKNAN